MIKYLTMGIKKIIKKHYCKECGEVLKVSDWSTCAECDYVEYRNAFIQKQVDINLAIFHAGQSKKKHKSLNDASIILTDDITGEIMGWSNY